MAGMFLLLSAEFVALALVLVYIGAVIVLFLFGVMITRAPHGPRRRPRPPAQGPARAGLRRSFGVLSWGSIRAFASTEIQEVGEPTSTVVLGESLLGRFVVPFEVVSFLLLAALIGGITIARKDLTPPKKSRQARMKTLCVLRFTLCVSTALVALGLTSTHDVQRKTWIAMLLNQFLVLGALLFSLGVYGLLVRRNVVMVLLAIELMLNAVNINLIAFEAVLRSTEAVGQVFAVFVITVAAAEVGIGLAIVLLIFRNRATANVDDFDLMRW